MPPTRRCPAIAEDAPAELPKVRTVGPGAEQPAERTLPIPSSRRMRLSGHCPAHVKSPGRSVPLHGAIGGAAQRHVR